MTPHNLMQRAETHKVHGRGRSISLQLALLVAMGFAAYRQWR